MTPETYELIIIGGGPGGVAAGVYAASRFAIQQTAPTNPAVRELRHGETSVSPTPFPPHKLES